MAAPRLSFLEKPGDLAQTPLAAILLEALNLRANGVLEVEHDGGSSRLYLRAGVPVGAQTFVGFKPLGQYLLARGLIDIRHLDESLARMAETHRPQGEILVEIGAISREALHAALSEQQSGYLAMFAGLSDGSFRFDAGEPVPEWTRGVRLSPLRLIVGALEKPQAGALVASALRLTSVGAVRLSAGYRQVADSFGWSPAEKALLARLEKPISLDDFFAERAVPPERARAMLAALVLLGLAEQAPHGAAEAARTPPGLVVDLVDVAAGPPATPAPARTPAAARKPAAPAPPARRADPDDARQRRQRLLARAMQNMGVGPLAASELHPTPEPVVPPEAGEAPSRPRAPATPIEARLRADLEAMAPRVREPDLFVRLGVPHGASRDQVKQAYLGLAKQFHPDRFASPALAHLAPKVKELFTAVNEAYEVLSNDQKRAAYQGRAGASGTRSAELVAESAYADFRKGEACVKTGDFARARGFLEAAVRQQPKAEYQAALAWCLMLDPARPNRERVKELLREAAKDASCDRAFSLSGVLAQEEGDEKSAEKMFRLALRANPQNAEALRELRLIESRRKKKGEERSASKK